MGHKRMTRKREEFQKDLGSERLPTDPAMTVNIWDVLIKKGDVLTPGDVFTPLEPSLDNGGNELHPKKEN